jgi:hypothetical protein
MRLCCAKEIGNPMKHIKLTYPGKTVDLELTPELTNLIQIRPGYRPSVTGRQLHALPKTLGLTLTGSFSISELLRIFDIVCDGTRKPTDDIPPAP